MAVLKTFVRGTVKLIVGLLLLLAGFYLILLAINWQDAEPNAASLHMQSLLQQDPIPAEQNGYQHLLAHYTNSELKLSEPLLQLHRQCNQAQGCNKLLAAQTDLAELIAEQHQLQAFYQQLLQYSQWQEPLPNPDELPYYQVVLHGQRLLLWQAWLDAQNNNSNQVKTALQADYRFWKNALANNTTLIGKMISTAALQQHFNLAPAVIAQLPAEQRQAAMPEAWAATFNDRELSLEQAMAGEWHLISENVHSVQQGQDPYSAGDDENILWLGLYQLTRPLLLVQDTKNITASQLMRLNERSEQAKRPWYCWLRNPIGRLLMDVGAVSYTDYQRRLLKLEQLRLNALQQVG